MFYRKIQEGEWERKEEGDPEAFVGMVLIESGMFLLSMLLFLLCAKGVFLSLFPEQKFPAYLLEKLLFFAVPGVSLGIYAKKCHKRYGLFLLMGAVGMYLMLSGLYFYGNHARIISGCRNLLESYLRDINVYYKISRTIGGNVHEVDNRIAIEFIWMTGVSFLSIAGILRKRKRMVACFPLFFLMLLLIVGKSPKYSVLVWGFAGGVVASFLGWYDADTCRCRIMEKKWYNQPVYVFVVSCLILGFTAIGIPLAATKVFQKPVQMVSAYAPEARAFQQELENTVESMLFARIQGTNELVNNRTPRYRGQKVMEVTIQGELPKENQYFRGFYGTEYVNRTWITGKQTFQKACQTQGYQEREVSDFLAFPARRYLEQRNQGRRTEIDREIDRREMTISYSGIGNRHVYLPYFLEKSESGASLSFFQDVCLEKSRFQKEQQFSTWDLSALLRSLEETGFLPTEERLSEQVLYMPEDENGKEWMRWYEDYVKGVYLTPVSEEQVYVKKIADRIRDYLGLEGFDFWEGKEEPEVLAMRNRMRLAVANQVALYLRRYQYQLELPPAKDGMDPVDFFLGISHEGYCVHFASAGVLLLRELGIPARYATGYLVRPDLWKENEDGSYTAVVPDHAAHAWTEVYLSGLGWVPVEMTTGVQGEQGTFTGIPSEEAEEESGKDEDTEVVQNAPEESEEFPAEETTASPSHLPEEAEMENQHGALGRTEKEKEDAVWISGILAGIIFLGGAVCAVWMYRKKKYRGFLPEKDHSRSKDQMIICRINQTIYQKLCEKRNLKKRALSDLEYGELLKRTYPQVELEAWDRFLEMARRARFSDHGISSEEIAFCQDIYVRVQERDS